MYKDTCFSLKEHLHYPESQTSNTGVATYYKGGVKGRMNVGRQQEQAMKL